MKKAVLLLGFAMCASIVFAQLKVTSDGKVGIGLTETPVSKFAVGATGDQYIRNYFYSDIVAMRVHSTGNSPYSANYWGTGLQVQVDVSSMRGDIGISSSAVKPSPTGSGRAIGLVSSAGNATNGYNWGVIGNLAGSNYGAGVLGGLDIGLGFVINDGQYAGYFYGNVKVTGTINGTVVSNSDIRYKDNVKEVSKDNVLKNILQLTPVSYNLKQIYIESASSADSAKYGAGSSTVKLYDEKSPMFQKKHFGLIAQDLQDIYPDLVYENDNGYLSVNYTELIPLLIQSIKELKEEVDILSSAFVNARSATANDFADNISQAVLYQNAPNPFTDRTEIKFNLPANTVHASICIFNMQGALIKQIPVSVHQSGTLINGSELTAGMYLYSLIADGKEIDTKRMILTK
ncbi:MAG: tail fiber domain-containing protein [Tannerella sp.]|jgi:hypothetical protein|nr:tail fiber domain-containing protein [Tannerella sp.]